MTQHFVPGSSCHDGTIGIHTHTEMEVGWFLSSSQEPSLFFYPFNLCLPLAAMDLCGFTRYISATNPCNPCNDSCRWQYKRKNMFVAKWMNRECVDMKRIAKFEKVSLSRFTADWKKAFPQTDEEECRRRYEELQLPARATAGSAGYDFFSPAEFVLPAGKTIRIPTGIRVWMEPGWVLMCYPRSGLGFKYRLQLDNTVGVIDSDYYASDNEGHIFAKLTNDSREGKELVIPLHTGFMQGIFTEFGITLDDKASAVRNGGFGSTGR